MNILIIPARGGSKRILRKNIKDFCGKPMIYWPIQIAKNSKIFDQIIVSTDDEEIADIAKGFGASIPFVRPPELSDDYCGINDVLSHAVSWLDDENYEINNVCCVYPTSVFFQTHELVEGYKALESGNWSYVFSATRFAYPIFRSFKQNKDGGVQMFFPEYYHSRSQDIPIAYHDAAQFYWAKPRTWKDKKRIFNQNSYPILLPNWRVQDIDDDQDLIRAELLFKTLMEMN